MMKYVERAFPWLLLLPALLPVVIWGGIVYPYLVPKTLLFYTISLLAVASFGLLIGQGHAFRYGRLARWETWVPGTLLVLAYVASYFGIGFYHSFWSIFVRGDGLLMLSGVTASFYFIVLSADRAFFERLLRIVAAVASFVAVYGIGEWLFSGGGRIGSLLGNAAFFAGYLGIALYATLAVARSLSGGWRKAAYLGAALQVIAIVLTATRGSMLALGVAFVLWLLYEAFFAKRTGASLVTMSAFATVARVTLIALVVFGGLFYAFRSELAHVPFQPIARVASASAHSTDIASRLFIWKHMVGQIEQSPWLGYGAEHIDVLFNRFYDPTQIVEQWFDRSHNAFLDYAAQYGIGGLVLYVALILAFITTAWRFARRGEEEKRIGLLFALLAVTYATQNFFVFDTISSFWLSVGLLAAFIARVDDEVPAVSVPLSRGAQYLSWPFALIMVVLIVPVVGQPLVAAYDLAHAYQLALTEPTRSVQYLKDGFALNTYGNLEYGYEAYDMYANHQVKTLTGAARLAAYQEAAHILTVDFNRYTYDARTALDLASVLSLAPQGTQVDRQLFSDAIARAIQLSPKRSQSWYLLENVAITKANTYPAGSTERTQGYAAALDLIKKYITLVPTLAEPRYVAAQLELAMGNTAAAAQEAALGKQYYAGHLKTAERAAAYYENVKDLPNAAFFLAQIVQKDPSNTAAANDLKTIQVYEQQQGK